MGITGIRKDLGLIRSQSRFFRTPAFPPGSGPEFVNAALVLETNASPEELLSGLHRIEASYGRTRDKRWGPRTLDLDLIAVDDLVAPDLKTYRYWRDLPLDRQMSEAPDELVLPHPRLQDRAFVLVPLAEIMPDWVHPVAGLSVQQMLAALAPELRAEVTAL